MRNLQRRTLASLQNCLLDPVAKLDPSYVKLGHFNLLTRIENPRSGESCDITLDDYALLRCDQARTDLQEDVDRTIDLSLFKPYGNAWRDDWQSTRNLLRQYYSLAQVTQMLRDSGEQPDIVIYARPDLFYIVPLAIPAVQPKTIYTPCFAKWGGLNDRFALGNLTTMLAYGERGTWAAEYVAATNKPLHSESLLDWYVRERGLINIDIPFWFLRARANGQLSPEPEILGS
jgi:hypothetical protein